MAGRVTAMAAAAACFGAPALAHPGPHDEAPSALVAHLLSDPFHAMLIALVVFALAALGVRRIARSLRGECVE